MHQRHAKNKTRQSTSPIPSFSQYRPSQTTPHKQQSKHTTTLTHATQIICTIQIRGNLPSAWSRPSRPLRLTIPPHIPTLLRITPPRIQLPQSRRIRPPLCLRYKPLSTPCTPRPTSSTGSTIIATHSIPLARIHQLKFLRLFGINLVLKFEIFIRTTLLVIAIALVSIVVAKVSPRGGVSGTLEGLGGEVGTATEAIGSAEWCVGELGEAGGGGGVFGGGGGGGRTP